MRELKLTLFCWQSIKENVLRQHEDIENGIPIERNLNKGKAT